MSLGAGFNGIAKPAAPRAGMRDRGGGRWSGWCKVYPIEDARTARVRVVKSDNTRATGSGLTALKEAPGAEGGAAASALPRRRARVVAQMATARIPMKIGAICAGCGPRACAIRPSVCRTVCCVDKHF